MTVLAARNDHLALLKSAMTTRRDVFDRESADFMISKARDFGKLPNVAIP